MPFPPNPLFEGRVQNLKDLAKTLCSPLLSGEGSGVRSVVINQAITGMGGLGKTQLAVEFAYRYGSYFRGVHWLDLANPSQLEAEIARCGMEMAGFAPNFPTDQPSQVALTLNTWKADGPRLLVLDNFEAVDEANHVLPRLRHSSLRLLVTSRRTDWTPAAGLHALSLEVFTPEESLAFLQNALKGRKDKDADLASLSERLGHLPLGLELASRYLNGHARLSIAEYLEQTIQAFDHPSMNDWRADLPAPTQHDLDLQHTFALSWEGVKEENAKKLFMTAGYLAPNTPIPLEIFEKALEISSDTCDELLNTLFGLGLLRKSEDSLPTIHPLLSEYARSLGKEDRENFESLANMFARLSDSILETKIPSNFMPIKLHLSLVATHAEKIKLDSAGWLWNNYGYYQHMIADYSGAKSSYNHALKIDEIILGSDHYYIAIRFNNLGGVMKAMGDLPGARAAYERALRIDEATFGPDHPQVATRVNNLGMVMNAMGDMPGARVAFERALKIFEKQLGENHPNIATPANNLGSVMQDMGDLPGARTAFERALKIDEATFGPDHPDVAIDVNNLGMVMKDMGDLPGARVAFERALKIFKQFLPPDHPNIKIVQRNLDSLKG